MTKMPVPAGTWLTMAVGSPKFGWLLEVTRFPTTRVSLPSFEGLLGRRKTRIPPVLSWASLSSTSAFTEFSISMPVTLWWTSLRLTTMSRD